MQYNCDTKQCDLVDNLRRKIDSLELELTMALRSIDRLTNFIETNYNINKNEKPSKTILNE